MAETTQNDIIIQFTFGLNEPEAEDSERLNFSRKLLQELRQLDEVESVERAENLNPEVGSKPGFETLLGILTTEVSFKNFGTFLEFLGNRLQSKPIKGKIKLGDNEVEFEVKSCKELAQLEQTTLNIIKGMKEESNA
ncbi:hypothetical protein [Planktothrix sp.]|uniref:hypothetical protein n=1 Tax=Planktothrix sp. TaxID=3088171 RepID=UPI0038D388AC